jgi:hypothetical protein
MILEDESLILEVVLSKWGRLNHSWCVWKVLESAKDQFLGVDPPGQHVPPRTRYGTTCLLIMELWICVLWLCLVGMAAWRFSSCLNVIKSLRVGTWHNLLHSVKLS